MAIKRWWPVLLVALTIPVAWAATLPLTSGTLGSGVGTPATCDSGAPTVVQNVGTADPNKASIVSVDVSGIVSACGNGTIKVSVHNGTDTAHESTATITAGGGSVHVPLSTPVALKGSHLVAVTLQAP